MFLDDDDELRVGYLNNLIRCIHLNQHIDFFWCDVVVYASRPDKQISRIDRIWPRKYWNEDHFFATALSVATSYGLCVRKEKLIDIGLFDKEFPVGEDMDLIIRLLQNLVLPKSIPFFGVNKFETTSERLSYGFKRYSSDRVFEKILSKNSKFF
ncbi:hypothetical protein [Teredinibacter haidensis]|uniref:hypothetical protein n=1 Tax=Teredinibacter haidensis TaxID=2731755 RepID=UPI000948A870|nr:hypothetical protein [Teredinibacter haidensis]